MSSLKVRSTAVLGTLGLALSWFGTAAAPPATPPMTPVAAITVTDKAHPYSDPVWWPLRTPSVVDCTKMNDCRSGPHGFYGIDVLSKPEAKGNDNYIKDAGVFAMGAGVAHIGDAKGRECGGQKYSSTTFGKWVWVDHGGGIVSKYGHLSKISIREGQLVTPDTRLGTVGNTGIANPDSCHIYYVDFLTKYPGINGPSVGREFSRSSVGTPDGRLLACSTRGELQVWPDDLSLRDEPTRMELVHSREVLPATGDGCRKNAVPRTASKPSGVKLATAGSGALKASWTKPSSSSVNKVRLELAEYHPTVPGWDNQKNSTWADVSATTTSKTFKDLTHKKRWRVRVWFHTKAGWSVSSSWVERTTT